MSIMERTIPAISNSIQDSHIPFIVPQTAEDEKILGDELVPSLLAPPLPLALVNDHYRVESPHSSYSPYVEWWLDGMHP